MDNLSHEEKVEKLLTHIALIQMQIINAICSTGNVPMEMSSELENFMEIITGDIKSMLDES